LPDVSTRLQIALLGLIWLLSGCVKCPESGALDLYPSRSRTELDSSLPFDFSAGEPNLWAYYAYPYGGSQPPPGYRLGWDELDHCLWSADPKLPVPARTSNILAMAQTMATSIARGGPQTTIEDLLHAGVVPGTLSEAGPIRASYYLGALLRCAEQGRLIARVGA
jgi:hypothetical protein